MYATITEVCRDYANREFILDSSFLHMPPVTATIGLPASRKISFSAPCTLSKVLKRIPCGSSVHKLSSAIDRVVRINDEGACNDVSVQFEISIRSNKEEFHFS